MGWAIFPGSVQTWRKQFSEIKMKHPGTCNMMLSPPAILYSFLSEHCVSTWNTCKGNVIRKKAQYCLQPSEESLCVVWVQQAGCNQGRGLENLCKCWPSAEGCFSTGKGKGVGARGAAPEGDALKLWPWCQVLLRKVKASPRPLVPPSGKWASCFVLLLSRISCGRGLCCLCSFSCGWTEHTKAFKYWFVLL